MVSRSDSSHAVCREAWLQPPLFAVSAASDMGWHWCFLPLVAAQLEPFALPPSFEGESSVKHNAARYLAGGTLRERCGTVVGKLHLRDHETAAGGLPAARPSATE